MIHLLEAVPVGDGRWAIVTPDPSSPEYVAWGVVEHDGTFDVWGDEVLPEDLHTDPDFEDLGHEVRYFEAQEADRKAGVPWLERRRPSDVATREDGE